MQILRYKQSDRKAAWFLRAAWLSCILVAMGASTDARGDIEITTPTTWENEVKQVSGRIRVRDGASLTLINSTVTFNCTFDNQYGIMVDGTGELVIKKSVIDTKKQGDGKYYGWFLLAGSRDRAGKQMTIDANGMPVGDGTRYWMWKLIGDLEAKTLIQIEDSHLCYIGNRGSTQPDKGICIWFWKVRTGSYVRNTFFDNTARPRGGAGYPECGCIKVFRHLGYIETTNNTFKNFYVGITIYGSGYAADKFLPFEGNRFTDVAMPIYTWYTRKIKLKNNKYYNNFSRYCIDIWGGPDYDKEIYICGEYQENVARPLVFNVRVSDVLVENVTQKQINSCLVGMNKYVKRMVVRHLTGDDLYYIVDGVCGGEGNTDNHFYDITVTNARYGGVLEDAGSRATFSDCRFSGVGKGPGIRAWHPECTYSNITLNKFAQGIVLSKATDCLFRDIAIKESGTDIYFTGSNSEIAFINVLYGSNKVRFSEYEDIFRPSYYCDVEVVDRQGKPIEGAAVKISNEVDQSIEAMNRLGKLMNTFRTGKDGHTPLPLPYKSANLKFDPPIEYDKDGNPIFPQGGHKLLPLATDGETVVLRDHTRTKSGLKNYTYTIEVEKEGYQPGKVTNVNPDSSWYRADPTKPTHTITVVLGAKAAVVGRHVFYNNSAFDGDNPAANADDDGAVAPDKTALLPGETATFANYTSYSRGINGIMIDIAGLPDTPTAADFIFKVGNDNTTGSWGDAPAPTSITVREGAGIDGADRITVIWADNAIQKQWLQVTVKATDATGLAIGDVFYFGNAIGETGDSATNAMVTPTDGIGARNNSHDPPNPAGIDDVYDFDRDRLVIPTDEILTRNNATNPITALKLITVP